MIEDFKNIITSEAMLNVLQKYSWVVHSKSKYKYIYNFDSDIADYYLNISFKDKSLNFEYVLDVDIPKNKIYDLFILINFVNEKSIEGYFTFNLKDNIIKYNFSKNCFDHFSNKIFLELIETNLKLTRDLFRDFLLQVHNFTYSDTSSQELTELMFLKTEGHA